MARKQRDPVLLREYLDALLSHFTEEETEASTGYEVQSAEVETVFQKKRKNGAQGEDEKR